MSKKKKVGWLIAALVLFVMDTISIFVFYEVSADITIDIVFHVFILGYLMRGILAYFKLKKMSVETM